jgi:hypothetical protein
MYLIFGPAHVNVNVATNGLRVIYVLDSGNVLVNEVRKFSWERSVPVSVIFVLSASRGIVCAT